VLGFPRHPGAGRSRVGGVKKYAKGSARLTYRVSN
jgi:hypothetical protein